MIHYYIKRKQPKVQGPVKILCNQVWVSIPPVMIGLASINCPDCLKILIALQKKRLVTFEANLLKATEPSGVKQ